MFNGIYEAVFKIFTLLILVALCSSLPTTSVNGTRRTAEFTRNVSSVFPSMTRGSVKVSSEVRNNADALVEAPVEVVGPRSVETETRIKVQKKRESEDADRVSVRDRKDTSSCLKNRRRKSEADGTDSTNHSRYLGQ